MHRLRSEDLSAEPDAWEYDADGSIRIAGTSLKLWISTDGGTTWQQERTRSHDGTYIASYHVPASSATSGSVSIRAQASDSAGDTVSQTIGNAYTITN